MDCRTAPESGCSSPDLPPARQAVVTRRGKAAFTASLRQTTSRTVVSLLTGGGDKPYALGISRALSDEGISLEFVGSNDLAVPEVVQNSRVKFLNLRGDQSSAVSPVRKLGRVLRYYARLLRYAAETRASIFHLLWNNKFEWFDRTLLLLYYRACGKRLVFTAHNVNAGKRDGNDSWINRATLGVQYRLVNHIFVHTEKMRHELLSDFKTPPAKVSVIPFGINNTLRDSALTSLEARRRLGLSADDKVVLFFGNILPYKGLEYLVEAITELYLRAKPVKLLIVGRAKSSDPYWSSIERLIDASPARSAFIKHIRFVPDEEVEVYAKAADVLVLPYTHIFQSGVLFVGYAFGLPVIAADVGSLKEEIVEGRTGSTFRPKDSADLAAKLDQYFCSELYRDLGERRDDIKAYANDRYSWAKVAEITTKVYEKILET